MSFTKQVKQELCKSALSPPCCATAECYALLLFAQQFSFERVRLVSEHKQLQKRVPQLLSRVFALEPTVAALSADKLAFTVEQPEHLMALFRAFGYDYKPHVSFPINRNIIENDCCKAAFLRGVFLVCGTVASPDKKCHLELTSPHQSLCRQLVSLLLDMEFFPKYTVRKGNGVIYFKDSTAVTDLLTLMGASKASLAMMQAKVEKELRNNVNRQVNCETANYSRTLDVAAKQIQCINSALDKAGWNAFPPALHDTIRLRLDNELLSLSELSQISDPPISKPGLSHRLKKIMELAQRINEQI